MGGYRGNMVKRKSATARRVQPRYRRTTSPEQLIAALLEAKKKRKKDA